MGRPIAVSTSEQLSGALVEANEGRRIVLKAGVYAVSEPLTVPRGASLEGEGVMMVRDGRALGMQPLKRCTLRAVGSFKGDLLTLRSGARLARLVIEDSAGRRGNLVAVPSLAAGGSLTAAIEDCDFRNPHRPDMDETGPIGRAIALVTRSAHDGSAIAFAMRRCVVRSDNGSYGLCAINLASGARIVIRLWDSRIGGALDATGGASRFASVSGSEVAIYSSRNLYESSPGTVPGAYGWLLAGGSTPPIPGVAGPPTNACALRLHSDGDEIRGYRYGIVATAGSRPYEAATPDGSPRLVGGNRAELDLAGTTIESLTGNLILAGARSGLRGSLPPQPDFTPGDDNRLRLVMHHVTTTGGVPNLFTSAMGAVSNQLPAALAGAGNRLGIFGDPNDFAHDNPGVVPPPPSALFAPF